MVRPLAYVVHLDLEILGDFLLEAEAPTEVPQVLPPVVVNIQRCPQQSRIALGGTGRQEQTTRKRIGKRVGRGKTPIEARRHIRRRGIPSGVDERLPPFRVENSEPGAEYGLGQNPVCQTHTWSPVRLIEHCVAAIVRCREKESSLHSEIRRGQLRNRVEHVSCLGSRLDWVRDVRVESIGTLVIAFGHAEEQVITEAEIQCQFRGDLEVVLKIPAVEWSLRSCQCPEIDVTATGITKQKTRNS